MIRKSIPRHWQRLNKPPCPFIRSGQVCKYLGISIRQLDKLDKAGALPHCRRDKPFWAPYGIEMRLWLLCDVEVYAETLIPEKFRLAS
jgi:hypothetical protein